MRPIDAHIAVEYIKNSDLPNHWKNALISCLLSIPTIAQPPNDPLTPEELLEMCGEPVWVVNSPIKKKDGFCDEWALVSVRRKDAESVGTIYHFENYGDYWLAYRRKPEEGTT